MGELIKENRLKTLKVYLPVVNFKAMLEEAIDTVSVLQPAYNININGDADVNVSGDRYRMIQVVTNYLTNGIKYSNGKNDVLLGVQHNENTITVSVKDQGLGLSGNQLPYIFDRFFRAEKQKTLKELAWDYFCAAK